MKYVIKTDNGYLAEDAITKGHFYNVKDINEAKVIESINELTDDIIGKKTLFRY